MNSPAPLPARPTNHGPCNARVDCWRQAAAQLHEAASEPVAQTDSPDPELRIERTEEADEFRSPLWAVAIGTGCLFAAMAAVLALG